jgi:DNA polymerase III subunit delta'
MRFADVIGHARARARLQRAAAGGRIPTAVLLLGPSGIGKRAVAEAFAARLLCESPADDDACGTCAQCTRAAAGTHPDRKLVERDEDRRDIRIEQVRETSRWLSLRPLMAATKVALIDGAHCLSEPAQNALLKTLEEPPPGSVLVLVAPSAALLLPTVRSRCQIVRLDPLPAADVCRVLEIQGVPTERAQPLAALAEGRPGAVLELEGAAQAEARDEMLRTLAELPGLDADQVSRVAQALSRGPLDVALAAAVSFYRDVLQVVLIGDELALRNPDAASAVRATAARVPATAVLRQLEAVCGTIDALGRNANKMLSLETMLLWLREIERTSPATPALAATWESAERV